MSAWILLFIAGLLETGWAIGHGEEYTDDQIEYQDRVESNALYDLLEKEIVPIFYERRSDGLPRGWIAKMKAAIRDHSAVFNTNRMVEEYCERFYIPCFENAQRQTADVHRAVICNDRPAAARAVAALADYSNPPSLVRLARLHGGAGPDRERLHASVEWQSTVERLRLWTERPVLELDA